MPTARSVPRILTAALVAALSLALAIPAQGADQEVQGIIPGSTSISTPPTAAVDFGTMAVGVNTISGGTIAVSSNVPYTVTVEADRTRMTEWDPIEEEYGAQTLDSGLVIAGTISSGAPVIVPDLGVGTSAVALFTGSGLTSDAVDLLLEQSVLVSDPPGTYRMVLTYTASPTL